MGKYEAAVIERYPDGTKWIHYFSTWAAAEFAVGLNKQSHPSRTYEIRDATD